MEKPKLQDYCITDLDLKKAKSIKKWLKIVVVVQMFLGIGLLGYGLKGPWMWIAIIFAVPPYGPVILYFLFKRIFLFFSRSLRGAGKYESDCEAFDKWWMRSREIFWRSLSGLQFEHELAGLFQNLGFEANVTSASDDQGVDIWIIRDEKRIPVQCKAHKRPIGPAAAREFYGSMMHFKADAGILASLTGFTRGVTKYVQDKPIELIDLNWIVRSQKKLKPYF